MHFHLEVIMPAADNVEAKLAEVLDPWNENADPDAEDSHARHGFFNCYRIGDRWSGCKLLHVLGAERVQAFNKVLCEHKITVSGFRSGKETLSPASQIVVVNQLWNEHFPESPVKECPLFDNYNGSWGDVAKLSEFDASLKCERVVIAGPNYSSPAVLEVEFMLADSLWNGVEHQKTIWDGTIQSALDQHAESLSRAEEHYKAARLPTPDWLCVTVDCHT